MQSSITAITKIMGASNGMDISRPTNGLSLCSGGGGLDMGLQLAEPGFRTRVFVEWEKYPQEVLIAAQHAGYFEPADIWDDVTTFDAKPLAGAIDTLLAGYPCQPFSLAGQRRGENDERHLWPDIERIIGELGDGLRWCFFENVAGHLTLGLETVLRSLRGLGFTPAVGLFSAEEVGAPHERQRVFIVAYRDGTGRSGRTEPDRKPQQPGQQAFGRRDADGCDLELAHPDGRNASAERQQRGGEQRLHPAGGSSGSGDVGNASGIGRGEGRSEHELRRGRDTSASAGGELADRNHAGPQGQRAELLDEERREIEARQARLRGGARLHPPGPSDMDAWRNVLAFDPTRAPAVSLGDLSTFSRYFAALVEAGRLSEAQAEPALCRMVDGLASRSRALRLLGNGVCPLAAGHAWRTLSAAHGLGRVDLGAASKKTTSAEADEPVLTKH